jgi:protein tyrosine/serine phosphatase
LFGIVINLRPAVSIFIAALALASGGRPTHEIGENNAIVGAMLGAAIVDGSTSSEAQTVDGTTLVHFGEVDQGVYKGSEPKTTADYEFLHARHIKYILDLELLPSVRHSEQKKAKRYGIVLLHGRLNASPIPPSHKHIERIMAILRNKRYHPIYFHCAYGRDRTSLVAALYKMYFLSMSQQDALQYMDESGYKDSWVRGGLKRYIEEHPSVRSK